jgi:hypothetical protein
MEKSSQVKIIASVSVDMHGHDAKIEKLVTGEAGRTSIRISSWKKGARKAEALTLSENQLLDLLYKASYAGVLSQGFIGRLHEKIEI